MTNASEILESLDAAEISQQLEALDKERQALLVLHRAAIRLDRRGNVPDKRPANGGGDPMIAPAHPLPTALDPVVRFRVADGAEPANLIPALATLLISQWREKHAQPQAEQQAGDGDGGHGE